MIVDSFKIYLLQIVILTIVSSCCAGELGFGDHGLSLGEIDVGHGEEEIGLGLGELGLVNISILFVNVINIISSKRATLEHRINHVLFYVRWIRARDQSRRSRRRWTLHTICENNWYVN